MLGFGLRVIASQDQRPARDASADIGAAGLLSDEVFAPSSACGIENRLGW